MLYSVHIKAPGEGMLCSFPEVIFMSVFSMLDKQQSAAVRYDKGDLMLAAGPGSGKTHTMTARILYLIEVLKVPPSSILVITFTKDAALSMQSRFNGITDGIFPVNFGTFHSVFYHMISDHRRSSPPVIIFDKNRASMAESCIRKFMGIQYLEDNPDSVCRLSAAISSFKNSNNAEKATSLLAPQCRTYFDDMLRYYEGIRHKTGQMDFDDMVYDCRELLLHDRAFASKWVGRFRHILIDEFQDINPMQYETVMLMSGKRAAKGKRSRLFAVGDDDQSIYGFRGSDPSMMNRLIREENAGLLHLDTNYRSKSGIVNCSLSVISENKNRINKKLISSKNEEGNVVIKGFENTESQYAMIAELCGMKRSDEGQRAAATSDKKAVLFRTNLEMQSFASFLTSKNIPYVIREKTESIFEHFIFKDILAYMKTASGTNDEDELRQMINRPQRYINYECMIGSGGSIGNIIRNLRTNTGIKDRINKMHKLAELEKDLMFAGTLSPVLALRFILKKLGYEKYVFSLCGDDMQKREEYGRILDKAEEIASASDTFEEFLELKERYENDLKKAKKNTDKNALRLMTVHASKGLEFDAVFIPNCNEGVFPHGRMPDEKTVEEERRIFYVAMTRAVSELYILYTDGKENSKYMPSRFLAPVINKKGKPL